MSTNCGGVTGQGLRRPFRRVLGRQIGVPQEAGHRACRLPPIPRTPQQRRFWSLPGTILGRRFDRGRAFLGGERTWSAFAKSFVTAVA
ncbi:hypothetical protein [Azospirillum endophyticum]